MNQFHHIGQRNQQSICQLPHLQLLLYVWSILWYFEADALYYCVHTTVTKRNIALSCTLFHTKDGGMESLLYKGHVQEYTIAQAICELDTHEKNTSEYGTYYTMRSDTMLI